MNVERSHLTIGLVYAALGMGLGIHMAATQEHGQLVTHAHLLLVGFLLSVIYAIIHRLWLDVPHRLVSRAQFGLHHLGVVMMVTGLYLLYGGHVAHERLEPLLASASIIVLIALLMMVVMVVRSGAGTRGTDAEVMPKHSAG